MSAARLPLHLRARLRGAVYNGAIGLLLAVAALAVFWFVGNPGGGLSIAVGMLIAVVVTLSALWLLLACAGWLAWHLGAGRRAARATTALVDRFNAEHARPDSDEHTGP